jgi:hypothetical protein
MVQETVYSFSFKKVVGWREAGQPQVKDGKKTDFSSSFKKGSRVARSGPAAGKGWYKKLILVFLSKNVEGWREAGRQQVKDGTKTVFSFSCKKSSRVARSWPAAGMATRCITREGALRCPSSIQHGSLSNKFYLTLAASPAGAASGAQASIQHGLNAADTCQGPQVSASKHSRGLFFLIMLFFFRYASQSSAPGAARCWRRPVKVTR